MERNDYNSQGYKLESQIRESYGNIVYSQVCHTKFINKRVKLDENIKIFQIILSGITTSGFILTIFSNDKISSIIGVIVSLVLLILNTYIKSYNIANIIQEHKKATDALWGIKEEYLSLLTDFEMLNINEIMAKRDELQEKTIKVYTSSPRIDTNSYKQAKKSIESEDEQTLSEKEIDLMLPNSIRRCSRKMIEN